VLAHNELPEKLRLFPATTPLIIAPERFSGRLCGKREFSCQKLKQVLGQTGESDRVSPAQLPKHPVTKTKKSREGRVLAGPKQ